MVLDYIETRIIAGFTVVSLLVFGVMTFKIKSLKSELNKQQETVKYYKQQTEFLKQQLQQLQVENQQLQKELEIIKVKASKLEETSKRIRDVKKQYNNMKSKINKVVSTKTPEGYVNEKKVIELINSFFSCDNQ